MGYQIAVATSDGIHIDGHFGNADSFHIYLVEDETYHLNEIRRVERSVQECGQTESPACGGCGGHTRDGRIESILDCRCVVCAKCGPGSEKQLSKAGITPFAVERELDDALSHIMKYFSRVDTHGSLRKFVQSEAKMKE